MSGPSFRNGGSHRSFAGGNNGEGGSAGGGAGILWTGTGQLSTSSDSATFAYSGDPGLGLLNSVDPGTDYILPNNYPAANQTFSGMLVKLGLGPISHAPLTLTLYKAGLPTAMQVTFPIGSASGTLTTDLAHPVAFIPGEVWDVRADSLANAEAALYTFTITLIGGPTSGSGTNVSGFGTPEFIRQLNDVGGNVTTWAFQNRFLSNVAGAETTTNEFTTLLSGQPVVMDFGKFNGAGRQNITTPAGVGNHTPTVLWGARRDLLVVTLGDTVTQLTVNGLNLDADYQYEVGIWSAGAIAGSGITVLRLNGDVNAVIGLQRYATPTAPAFAADTVASFLLDNPAVATPFWARALVTGVPGLPKAFESHTFYQAPAGFRYIEDDCGITNAVANVTSAIVFGNLNAGDVVTFRCTRLRAD